MILLTNLTKAYADHTALDHIRAEFPTGKFTAVIGRSGAGKSTLLRCINGLTEVSSGRVEIDGQDMAKLRGREKRALQRRIGMIFQDFCLVGQSTALQNVLNACLADMGFFRVLLGLFSRQQREAAMQMLKKVGLADKAQQKAASLSGGEKQRVAIARVLLQGCDIVLADEPVASLDPVHAETVLGILKRLQTEDGKTVIMNSHNVEQARRYADIILGVRNGRIVFSGMPDALDSAALERIYGKDGAGA
ncbi:MAG: phosphonate ABC transporter ATP-binding protein [Oscillospiraceae bacterium]|nr:phosphonate ABC transporter ATP-binding protein [Oscillospiraceae bacterium]